MDPLDQAALDIMPTLTVREMSDLGFLPVDKHRSGIFTPSGIRIMDHLCDLGLVNIRANGSMKLTDLGKKVLEYHEMIQRMIC
jgi:hypothetical protein